ncbi:NrdH-redoxin [Lysobacteraceae bacterium NML03-0222]|nr:NrdH-redoxin [Xanthomonadaceae bacterium NML03-0222]PJK04748.1 NrdH-redoxin [Xanthomonadaceae bacterium NML71-0210]PJK15416.1 NrdH-redoxin [Xanthomonadaceae bacterium NML07-0707]
MRALWLLLAVALIGGVLHFANQAASSKLAEHDPRNGTGDNGIVMLYADWCGYCRKQRADFKRASVKYQALNIDSPEGQAAMQALGARGVPVTVVGQEVVHGYNTARLQELLSPQGYRVY